MSPTRSEGSTPLERLKTRFEDDDLTCPACGHEDADGRWAAETDGRRVRYRHVCPRCGAIRTRTYDIDTG